MENSKRITPVGLFITAVFMYFAARSGNEILYASDWEPETAFIVGMGSAYDFLALIWVISLGHIYMSFVSDRFRMITGNMKFRKVVWPAILLWLGTVYMLVTVNVAEMDLWVNFLLGSYVGLSNAVVFMWIVSSVMVEFDKNGI